MNLVKIQVILIALFLISNTCYSQAGSLDPGFNGNGRAITSVGTGHDQALAVAIQPDGKIVVAGSAVIGNARDFAVVRYNVNGTLDNTFSGDGKLTIDFSGGEDIAQAVSVLANGTIIVAGSASVGTSIDFGIAVITTSGVLDKTFSSDGKLTTDFTKTDDRAFAMEISNNRIILAGTSLQNGIELFAVAMYLLDGTLDFTFSQDGLTTIDVAPGPDFATSLAIQLDQKIIVGGYSGYDLLTDFSVVRLNRDGSLDTGFNHTGKIVTDLRPNFDRAHAIAVQADQKIVQAGFTYNVMNHDFALIRYLPDGNLDKSFAGSGKLVMPIGQFFDESFAMKLQPDGKILMAGEIAQASTDADFGLARFNSDGTLDKTFSGDGLVATPIGAGQSEDVAYAMALQADGKIILAGEAEVGSNNDFAVARFISGLMTEVNNFSTIASNINLYPNPIENELANLEYQLHDNQYLSLYLCNQNGIIIKTFFEYQYRPAGIHAEKILFENSGWNGSKFLILSNGKYQKSIQIVD